MRAGMDEVRTGSFRRDGGHTVSFRILVQQPRFAVELLIDLFDLPRDGGVDVRSCLDGFHSADEVCRMLVNLHEFHCHSGKEGERGEVK